MFDFKIVSKAVLYVHILFCSYFILFSGAIYLAVYAAFSAAFAIFLMTYKGVPKKYIKYCVPLLLLGLDTLYGFHTDQIGYIPLLFLAITCISSLYADLRLVFLTSAYSIVMMFFFYFATEDSTTSAKDFILAFIVMLMGQITIIILLLFSINTIKNTNAKTEQVQDLLQEVDEKRSEAENAGKAKSDFLANMSHEIRTPMNAICGMVELLIQSGCATGQNLEYLNTIKVASDGLLNLINDILDISKIESGKMELIDVDYNITSTVNDIINIINTRVDTQKVAFYVNMNPRIPSKLYGDEIKVRQIIMNLLSNAVKFTHEGFISLNIDYEIINADSLRLEFVVNDSGIGIKPEHLEKIFSEFQQVDTRRNRNIQGTGLGLSISKNFAEMMGGSITIESTYGVGSTFSVVIIQKIRDFAPCATVNSPEQLYVLSYEPNKYYLNNLDKLFNYLEIRHDVTDDIEEYNVLLNCRKYTHSFFDFENGINVINTFIKENSDCICVGMIGSSGYNFDYTDRQRIMLLRKPLSFTSVVPILNGTKQISTGKNGSELSFVAPDAKVLLVDDNIVNLKVAEGLFKTYEVKVDTATGGFEAIDKIKEHMDYDIIFMDHMMPQIDGVDTTRIIRNSPEEYCKKVPIIAFSANAVKDAQLMFLENGFDGFLSKPIEVKALKQVMTQWIPANKQIKAQPLSMIAQQLRSDSNDDKFGITLKDIDTNIGLASCMGDTNAYKDILKIFASSGEKNISLIEQAFRSSNLSDFTTYVHSVKSSSKSIGALALSDLAMNLENAGKKEDKEYINLYANDFLNEYKKIIENINSNINSDKEDENKFCGDKEIEESELKEKLNAIKNAIDDYDAEAATKIFEELSAYNIREDISGMLNVASEKLSEFEYDDAASQINDSLALL